MKRLFAAAIFLVIQCACASEIHVPESWSQGEVPASEVPYQMPPAIRPMIRVIPPTKDGTASISQMEPRMSLDEAAKSYIRGMPMRGITVDSTSNESQSGQEGRRIIGHMSFAGRDVKFGDVSHLHGSLNFVRFDKPDNPDSKETFVDGQDPQAVFRYSTEFHAVANQHKQAEDASGNGG